MSAQKPHSTEKPPLGRPSLYKPEYCDMVIEHMAQGKSFETFGLKCNPKVHRDTLYEWAKVHPAFSDAKKIGNEARLEYYESLIHSHLYMPKDSGTFAHPMMMFLLKSQYGYRDHQVVEHRDSPESEAVKKKLQNEIDQLKNSFAELGLLNRSGAI